MEDPRIISALFIFLKMAYYNVLINMLYKLIFVLSDPDNSLCHVYCILLEVIVLQYLSSSH